MLKCSNVGFYLSRIESGKPTDDDPHPGAQNEAAPAKRLNHSLLRQTGADVLLASMQDEDTDLHPSESAQDEV